MADLILVFNNRGIIASTLMAHDVFISYARGDHSRAAQLASVLAAKGWSVWWDRDILPGRTFDDVIEEALTNARSVVVLWSAESVKSRWVRTEASAAAERDALVPALIEPVTIPLEFRRVEAADLTNWQGAPDDPELQQLIETLDVRIRTDARPGTLPVAKPHPTHTSLERRWPAWLPIVAAFIAGAALVYLAVIFTGPRSSSVGGSSGASSSATTSSGSSPILARGQGEASPATTRHSGRFTRLASFQTKNIRLYPSPWQEFKFEAVRARYFKLHVISAWDAEWKASPKVNEWQLLGAF